MLSDTQKKDIARTWRLVLPIADTAADLFYKRLFELEPAVRPLFSEDMTRQRKKLMQSLHFIVRGLDWPDSAWADTCDEKDDVVLVVLALGRRHRQLYHVEDRHYDTVREALMWALDQGLGEAFTPEVRKAWEHAYDLISLLMKSARDQGSLGTKGFAELPGEYELPTEASDVV